MKLRHILENILLEIGTITKPTSASYNVSENGGTVKFNFSTDVKYTVDIRIPIKSDNKIALVIDFYTDSDKFELTNQNKALEVMANIVGAISEWIVQYKEKFDVEPLQIMYIKYDPKQESTEIGQTGDFANKRDRVYRYYIEKFAKQYNSNVTFTTIGGITSKFNPPLSI